MCDGKNSQYFDKISQKKKEEVNSAIDIEIAEARMKKEIGEKEREVEKRKKVAQREQEAVTIENKTKEEIIKSNTEYKILETQKLMEQNLKKIEADICKMKNKLK